MNYAHVNTSLGFQSTLPVSGERCWIRQEQTKRASKVSIHAPRFRGAMRWAGVYASQETVVSIHAPRFRGAMQKTCWQLPRPPPFQSTLPVSGERCLPPRQLDEEGFIRFNPRSPFPGSDAPRDPGAWRGPGCFNPRSPFPGSDAGPLAVAGRGRPVSIHAPRFRGAMRHRSRPPDRRSHGFNPRSPFPGSDAGQVAP